MAAAIVVFGVCSVAMIILLGWGLCHRADAAEWKESYYRSCDELEKELNRYRTWEARAQRAEAKLARIKKQIGE